MGDWPLEELDSDMITDLRYSQNTACKGAAIRVTYQEFGTRTYSQIVDDASHRTWTGFVPEGVCETSLERLNEGFCIPEIEGGNRRWPVKEQWLVLVTQNQGSQPQGWNCRPNQLRRVMEWALAFAPKRI